MPVGIPFNLSAKLLSGRAFSHPVIFKAVGATEIVLGSSSFVNGTAALYNVTLPTVASYSVFASYVGDVYWSQGQSSSFLMTVTGM